MQAKAAELRERALPDSGEDRAKDVASYRVSKRIRELETERDQGLSEVRKELEGTDAWRAAIGREIAYIEHRLGSLPWPSEADVAAKNAERLQSTDGDALLSYALANTDWDARRWSSEELVLVALLARRRVELAAPKEAWVVRDTLARALAWLGRGDEALAMADSAIALAGKLANWARRNKEHMQAELASWTGEARRKREAKLVEPRRELADLPSVESIERALEPKEASVSADYGARIADVQQNAPRGTWRFGRSDDEWWHAQLAALESDLAGLEQMRAAAHEANRTERAQRLWSEAIESIERSAKYAGQLWPSGERLTPQAGLLPLGENPATGLWEFAHLQSGTEPALGPDGRVKRSPEGHLTPTPETGMVLVLLPGGRVPKADSPGQSQEDWITTVDLVPFFLSKYELTAEQWDRLFLRRGHSREEGKSLAPASAISWDDISLMWHREFGWCDFPSETQWEYACRGGTTSTWWTGNDAKDLRGVANIENEQNAAARILPVGTLRANAFGLHDVHGNVREWCRSIPPPRGSGSGLRPFRGGGGYDSAWNSRAAHSVSSPPGFYREHYGLRPFRRITP